MTRYILILTVLLLAPWAAVHADEPPVTGLSESNKNKNDHDKPGSVFSPDRPSHTFPGRNTFSKAARRTVSRLPTSFRTINKQ